MLEESLKVVQVCQHSHNVLNVITVQTIKERIARAEVDCYGHTHTQLFPYSPTQRNYKYRRA